MTSRTGRRLLALLIAAAVAAGLTLLSAIWRADAGPGKGRARNVILINGDGMAAAQREAARLYLAGLDGRLTMDQLPVSGQLTTSPRDPKTPVTDSAAAATAWATGERTYNGAISVALDGRPLPTLGARAKAAGRATGLVTTAQVTDASPAAFFANTANRSAQDEIARQYVEVTKPDVILGGGEDWWLPAGAAGAYPDKPAGDQSEASRGARGDLIAEARGEGYQYVSTADQLQRATGGKLLGLFANEELFQQRREGEGDAYDAPVSLATMTARALSTLSRDEQGFFLFVEEEGIDEFAHENNGARMLQALGELEKAVVVARDYAASHPDTLVVVTGDHECGGLTVEDTGASDESGVGSSAEDGPFPVKGSGLTFNLDWTTSDHTGVDVPVTAYGPLAEEFTGKHPNTHVHDVLARILTR
ncbi:alkaline phosphatase [Micromonospora sp. 4G57]|uniref:Alkaline phosphatase n=1 Tax=Micromonospora sicca TaxID=2202420 RepID=A0ABU5JB99_9ACTN|nr:MULTISPECIES: alkaline phosphatase [unclassified Micromonospora]MDZ5444309.1 alkaline phosphatase [Micromonospora sp. 4G57]MDZ5489857.1 alkaline phosphatase [Micromonospora sp. 4G53]